MYFHQATSPVIRARTQALIRIGGEQGRAAVSGCFSTGSRACGLFVRPFGRREVRCRTTFSPLLTVTIQQAA